MIYTYIIPKEYLLRLLKYRGIDGGRLYYRYAKVPTGFHLGYSTVDIPGIGICYTHQVVWLMHHVIPTECQQVIHRDGNRSNNCIENLELVPRAPIPIKTPYSNTRTGYRGVSRTPKRFRAEIRIEGVHYYLGLHNTAKDASDAYERAFAMSTGAFQVHI